MLADLLDLVRREPVTWAGLAMREHWPAVREWLEISGGNWIGTSDRLPVFFFADRDLSPAKRHQIGPFPVRRPGAENAVVIEAQLIGARPEADLLVSESWLRAFRRL